VEIREVEARVVTDLSMGVDEPRQVGVRLEKRPIGQQGRIQGQDRAELRWVMSQQGREPLADLVAVAVGHRAPRLPCFVDRESGLLDGGGLGVDGGRVGLLRRQAHGRRQHQGQDQRRAGGGSHRTSSFARYYDGHRDR
jgi:hypothetical protein